MLRAVITGKINLVDLAGSENNKVGGGNITKIRQTDLMSSSLGTTLRGWPSPPRLTSPSPCLARSYTHSTLAPYVSHSPHAYVLSDYHKEPDTLPKLQAHTYPARCTRRAGRLSAYL
jgi:hypothetical protein